MCIGRPKPQTPAPPPPLPEPAKETDPAVARSRASERSRAALAAGRDSTVLTGGASLTDTANTNKKTLLGQ
jgi:hypothetical protein